jgi:EAL domain-containing protein (putative c-di-GMP-specific phosphodiesterase class I)
MHEVKRSGRNDARFFAQEMSTCLPERLALENDLRNAVERRELELHYQPKVDLRSGRTSGTEALVRWRHPRKGLLPPAQFIPLAEEIGVIAPLGVWVLREACRQSKAWQDEGLPPLRVAVNISASQLRQDLLNDVADALKDSRLEPKWLELEITESVVMQNASESIGMLERLSGMGIHLSIDDFGTGYSSLSYLKRFPLSTLKIDGSFIQDISRNHQDAAIVRAIVALAHSLRLMVVAEGVENEAQLHCVRSLGSDEYQGFLHSEPLPAFEFGRFLKAGLGLPLLGSLAAPAA